MMPEGVKLVEFTDDVAMAINVLNTELIKNKANSAILIIHLCVTDHGLDLALDKTETAVIAQKRTYCFPEISLIRTRIPIRHLIDLCVELDKRLTTKLTLNVMLKATGALFGLMSNIECPFQ